MATKAKIAKSEKEKKKVKFSTRKRNRCEICGRPRGYIRQFAMCRICFRNHAIKGELPGVKKSSW